MMTPYSNDLSFSITLHPFRFADITVQSLLRSFNFTSFTRVAFTVDAHCICTSLVFCVSNATLLSCIFQIINSQCSVNGEMYTYPSKKDLLGFRNTLAMLLLVYCKSHLRHCANQDQDQKKEKEREMLFQIYIYILNK